MSSTFVASQLIAAQVSMGRAAGLPAPGTSDARRLAPLLAKPQVDARAPEVRQEHAQVRDVVKQSRRQQRKQAQETRRADKALRQRLVSEGATNVANVSTDYDPSGMPRHGLDLSLIHEPRRRAKLTAIGGPR